LKFTGQAIAIADAQRFQGSMGEPLASVSGNGVLVFQNLGSRINELNWVDVRNLRASRLAEGPYFDPRLSPDGSRVAAERSESSTQSDLWLLDVSNGSTERLTSDPGLDRFPQWSEDGSRVLFATNREGKYALRMRSLSGSVGEQVVPTIPDVLLKWPTDWCPARGLMAYSAFQSQSAYDIWLRSDDGSCKPVVSTPASETGAMLTRDGEWMAFESNVSGRREIYCQRTQGGSVYRVSQAGGVLPHWRADGRELYFYSPASHELLAVRHSNGEFGAPRRLFQQPELLSYDVDAAGLRFLCCSPAASEVPDQLTVLVP
jgi:Tol biopolymer transport system component